LNRAGSGPEEESDGGGGVLPELGGSAGLESTAALGRLPSAGPVVRLFSHSHAVDCFCGFGDEGGVAVRLGCDCVFHFACIAQYVKSRLGSLDGSVRRMRGLVCPKAGLAGMCAYQGSKGSCYFLSPDDLRQMVSFQHGSLPVDDDDAAAPDLAVDFDRITEDDGMKLEEFY